MEARKEYDNEEKVVALIEVTVTPQRGVGYDNLHFVAIQGVAWIALMNEYIAIQLLALHIHRTRGSHIDHTLVVWHLAATKVIVAFALALDIALLEQGVKNMLCEVATLFVRTTRCGSQSLERKLALRHLSEYAYNKARAVTERLAPILFTLSCHN